LKIFKYIASIILVSSCASSPVQQGDNLIAVNKIINTTHIKKPIRRSTADSKALIKKIENKMQPTLDDICIEYAIECNWEISQEVNMTFNAYANIEDNKKKIVLFTGLVSGVHYEEELAFVLAHEIAHHLANHINESRLRTYAGMAVGSVVGASVGDPVSGALYGGAMARNSFSVSQEIEADLIAARLLHDTGYDLIKAKMVLFRMNRMGSSYYTEWLASHPSGPDRILKFEEAINEIH